MMPRLLRTRVLVLCGVALFVLSGCLGSPPTQFTSCRPSPAPTRRRRRLRASATSRWGRPGDGAPYLDRPQLVTRTSRAKLVLADLDQWAGPLADTIARVLAENLPS